MCTNIQYLSKEIKDGKLYPEWVFKGSVVSDKKKSRDLMMVEVQWIKSLLDKGLAALVGCGSCLECRVADRKSMACRLSNEARYWERGSFITLTYAPEHLPKDGSVNSVDPARFIANLRSHICREYGKCRVKKRCRGLCPKIKTFGCREYGDKLLRPHYHLCVFGYQFPDLDSPRLRKNDFSKKTWKVFRSKLCARLWGKGFIEIGNLEPAAAEYVCGYTVKKIRGIKKEGHYGSKLPEGVVCRSQGIGRRFVEQYADFLLRNGMVAFRKSNLPLPRYYKKLLKKMDKKRYLAAVKNWTKEKELSQIYKAVSPLRAKARNKIKKAELALQKGELEYAVD